MKVYKYRFGSKRDLQSLKEDYFFAPHPSKLNDPCENLFSENPLINELLIFEKFMSKSTDKIKQSVELLCKQARNVGVYSLSKNVLDELLWAYYANSHRGFCIEYDFHRLKEFIKPSASFDVEYESVSPQLSLDLVLNDAPERVIKFLKTTIGIKSKAWKHEEEIRVVMETHGKVEYDFRAVKAIYFGLRMPRTMDDLASSGETQEVSQDEVMETLKGRGIKYYQIALKEKSYEFEFIEIEDKYLDAPKYKQCQKEIDKKLINYEGYGWEVDKEYFDKVGEIISFEPKLQSLWLICLDKVKSEENNQPTIRGMYCTDKDQNKHVSRFYTLEQVDNLYIQLKSE